MGQTVMRSVTVFNAKKGVNVVFNPGDELPEWAEDKVTNPKVFVPAGYDEESWQEFQDDADAQRAKEDEELLDEFDEDDLSKNTIPALIAYAQSEDIELGDARKKADIIETIEKARGANS